MKKRAILMVCAAALALTLLLSGCPAAKKTGSLTLSVTVPPGPSVYPQVPNPWCDKVRTSRGHGRREIPPGTEYIDVTIYNTSTLWSHTTTIEVTDPGVPQTTTINAIPVGSGYTVEVFPYDSLYGWSLVAGQANGVTVAEGDPTPVNLTLTRPSFSLTSMPASVNWGDLFTVVGNMTLPVNITTYTHGVIFYDNLIDFNTVQIFTEDNISFSAGAPVSISMNNTYYESMDGNPAPGVYHLYLTGIGYMQPLTGNEYALVWMPSSDITLEVLASGSVTVHVQ